MIKLLLLLALLLAAYGLAIILIWRLMDVTRQLSALRVEAARNDDRLQTQMQRLMAVHAAREAAAARLGAPGDTTDHNPPEQKEL